MKIKNKKLTYNQKRTLCGLIFVMPWVIGFLTLFARPLIQSIAYSFSKVNIEPTGIYLTFVGMKNYIFAFTQDPTFVRLLTESLIEMAYQVPIIVIYSLFIATILNQKFKGRIFVRGIFFLPVIIASGIVISIIRGDALSQMLMSGEKASTLFKTSALQQVLLESGLQLNIVEFLTGIADRIFEFSWKSGIQIILFLAGLQTIPKQLYEASAIEGATPWESFWSITFPLITPIMLVNIVYTMIDNFTDYSNSVMTFIIDLARTLNIEYSAALSLIYFTIVFIVIGIVYIFVNKRVFYIVD